MDSKFVEHSTVLNSFLWRMAVYLGETTPEQTAIDIDPEALFDRFMAKAGTSTYQDRIRPWMLACFGEEISNDIPERNHRFLEEALELVQANNCTREEAHQLVDYVFNRPTGELHQEVGGVMVTLAALCLATKLDMVKCGEDELTRVWTKVEKIRAKQAAKPKFGPLPIPEFKVETIINVPGKGRVAVINHGPADPQKLLGQEVIINGRACIATGIEYQGELREGSNLGLIFKPKPVEPVLTKEIIFLAQNAVVGCDAKCDKAWGTNTRPHVDGNFDKPFLRDYELGKAPDNPGTYEGDDCKPRKPEDRLNKWCVRECERSAIEPSKEELKLPNFEWY